MTKHELVLLIIKLLSNEAQLHTPLGRKVLKEEDIKSKIRDIKACYSFSDLRKVALEINPDTFIPETLTRARLVAHKNTQDE